MIVDLLRHGETIASTSGAPNALRGRSDDALSALSPAGWAQMRVATEGYAYDWQVVVTSPLARCAAFAQAFAAAHGLPLERDARLAELDFGAWEGVAIAALMQDAASAAALGRFWRDPWRHPPPGGEPLEQFEARVREAWRELAARHRGRRMLLVTHGGVIRLLLCAARGLPRSALLDLPVPHASLHRLADARLGPIADDGAGEVAP